MNEKKTSIKSGFIGFGISIILIVIGGFIGTTQKGCTGGIFDAVAKTGEYIPRCADSMAKKNMKPVKRYVKAIRLGQIKSDNLYKASLGHNQYETGMDWYRRDSAKFEEEWKVLNNYEE